MRRLDETLGCTQAAIKFYMDKSAFQRERALYNEAQLKPVMPATLAAEDNASGTISTPYGYTFPPFVIIECGQSLNEWSRDNANKDFITVFQVCGFSHKPHDDECVHASHHGGVVSKTRVGQYSKHSRKIGATVAHTVMPSRLVSPVRAGTYWSVQPSPQSTQSSFQREQRTTLHRHVRPRDPLPQARAVAVPP